MVCFQIESLSQEYSIIKVKGDISYSESGDNLKVKDNIENTTKLVYSETNDYAIGFNPKNGSRYFRLETEENNTNFLPTIAFSSRSSRKLNDKTLKYYFSDSLLLLDKLVFTIEPNMHIDTFFIKYQYKNESINKLLSSNNSEIIIERNELFKVDNNPIMEPYSINVSLFFIKNKKVFLVNGFTFICPDLDKLSNEIIGVKQMCSNIKIEKTETYLLQYLNAEYGKIQLDVMKSWLKSVE